MQLGHLLQGQATPLIPAGQGEDVRDLPRSRPVDDELLALADDILGDALHAAGFFIGVHAGVIDQEIHSLQGVQRSLNVPEVVLRLVDLDVEVPGRIGRLPGVERVDGDISEIDLLVVAKDIEGATARMRVEIEDADGLDLLQGLKRGEGQPIELAEAVTRILTCMVQAAGEAARAAVLQRLFDGIAHTPSRGEDAVQ